ncbi:hypothetical protein [Hymenobacter negativus]|uniref:WD40 repeat domain-containing protein n=1 Tax=Hymenobacter negativus TaxID=2795026 RepID=A0ABS3Q8P7_9BACT|nr:hypothetical protein [Hymenobacter negativus]MBO2007620.1 hypothetical protein [Hymenobacter negativus]
MAHSQAHYLQNQKTGQSSTLTLSGTQVSTETQTGGKKRRTEKHFATAAEATTYAERQEWALLKKGFVLHHEAAAPGQPLLHCFIGGGYTGSLAFADTPLGLYVYQNGWFRSATDQQDFLLRLDATGQVLETLALPTILAWDMHYQPAWQALVLDLDHIVFEYQLATGQFRPLSERSWSPASFVAVAGGRTAFVANDELVVMGPDRSTLFRMPIATQLFNGSLGFAAALARSGEVLAVHTTPGEVQLRSALDGSLQHTLTGDFGLLRQLDFMGNDQFLLFLEPHSTERLRCFDLAQHTEIDFTLSGGEEWPSWVKAYCLNADQTRLAVLKGRWVEVFGVASRQLVRRFYLSHCVKNAKLRFIGDALGARTDYGCFSLYQV